MAVRDRTLTRGLLLAIWWGLIINLFFVGFARTSVAMFALAIVMTLLILVAFSFVFFRVWMGRWFFKTQ